MTALAIANWTVRIAGLAVLLLGLLIWTGNGVGVTGIHMLLGLVLVVALWVEAFMAVRAGVSMALAVVAVAWGLLVIGLGMTQSGLLVGDQHWIVQVAHLLVGIVAIGLGEMLAMRAARAGTAV